MNGDLSLSRALGGLRIANPDDASPSPPPQELSTEDDGSNVERSSRSTTMPREKQESSSYTALNPSSSSSSHDALSTGEAPSRSTHHTFESAAAILKTAQDNLNAARGLTQPMHSADQHLQPQYASASSYQSALPPNNGGRPAGTRPISNNYPSSAADEREQAAGQYGALRTEPSRSSLYMLARSDTQADAAELSAVPSRKPSRSRQDPRQGPGIPLGNGSAGPNSLLPPRKSSKGMGGGYASIPGVPHVPSNSSFGSEVPQLASSEEWKDRGAAVSFRKEVDAEGKTVIKSVKKGVRDFSFGRILGEGSYSTVYLATDRQTLREYAIKVLEKKHIIKEKKIKYVNIEKNTLNRLTEHPGIVRLYYTFQDETSLYYVLDLCSGGELLGVLKKTGTFDIECTRFYGAQILDAVEYMHSRGVIHRDLKPENVLLDDNMHVKITDFGTAKLLDDPKDPKPPDEILGQSATREERRNASFVGTAEYVSPELLTDKAAGKPSDIWAFGCILYQLLAGRPPFKGASEYLTFQKIVNLEYEFPAGFPPTARDLIERCLVRDPAQRLTVEHIKNHDFFDGQQFGKGLWKAKAPRLKPYAPPTAQESHIISLNGAASVSAPMLQSRGSQTPQTNGSRPARIITELPPPTQLDIEWSPVLTRNNERILKLGDLMVISSPIPHNSHGKGEHGDGHKKLSRFFGGSTTKKRQRLVMVTSSGRIVLAPAGGEEKRAKQEISLLGADCTWKSQTDAKGQTVWSVDTGGVRYTFEELKSSSPLSGDAGKSSADDWIESLERAKDLAMSQNPTGFSSDNGFGDMSSSMSSPASTLGGRANYPEFVEGFSISDRSGRNQLSKSQVIPDEANVRRNRFSKRQSKNGLGAAF